ncbi:TPA_asm: maturation protein [ssRNA phage Gephyllon.2_11]|uniref:Maturation protein n=2 Tax=Norzivirales TaxID=2842247 RepID=A0A8S5L1N2_9VIRU|nr:maturation protein [ssRNA phage Gephyllon.2_11]QDH86448.1 MAG: hypothetical protein H2BulkLitter12623_000003 [Leviviridae sp.]DAD51512.1 TPA_asm: maturation protein [ssRNA phage Gephyllon.2_11]
MPGWRDRIKRKIEAGTNYDAEFQSFNALTLTATAAIAKLNGKIDRYTLSGTPAEWLANPLAPYGNDLGFADSTARQKFIEHYRQRRTQFQSGIFLGELVKTIEMISSPAKALRRGIDSYVKVALKRARKAKDPRGVIADTWLEHTYGWQPLVSDVSDAMDLRTAQPYAVFENISGRGKSTPTNLITKGARTSSFLRVLYNFVNSVNVEVKYKGQIGFWNNPPNFGEQMGLSWSNALPTAWELIPYSFLVDYFSNVGKVIDGISTGRVDLAWGTKLTWVKSECQVSDTRIDQAWLSANTPTGAHSSGSASGGGDASSWSLFARRTVSNISFGIGDMHLKLPGSNTKWTNIAGLAASRYFKTINVPDR